MNMRKNRFTVFDTSIIVSSKADESLDRIPSLTRAPNTIIPTSKYGPFVTKYRLNVLNVFEKKLKYPSFNVVKHLCFKKLISK